MIRFLLRLTSAVVRWQYWILAGFGVTFLLSLTVLMFRFYADSTVLVPTVGGTYIEGSVGEVLPWNPWFTVTNDVNRDIVSLVFSGLLKYNPQTKRIEDDLGSFVRSKDGRMYTVTLKDGLFWHDSTESNPHPVTADDVVYTFQTVQDPEFPNTLLRQNFSGVAVEKVDERTVNFRLEEPYSFFPSNLTLGLLPKRSFEGIPAKVLDQTIDFGFQPVGAGPYKFKSLIQTELSAEVTLEAFDRPSLPPPYRLERVVFRIFSDYPSLLSDIRSLDGIRLVPHNDAGEPVSPSGFRARNYTLPQYVGLFFNLDQRILSDQKLRLGLQLGTNKQEIVDTIHNAVLVDTPLLEIDTSDWRYAYDDDAAQGALFESQWYFPEKVRLQKLLEQKESNDVGLLRVSPLLLLETGATLTLTGTYATTGPNPKVNGLQVSPRPAASGSWIVRLPTAGTGRIRLGDNLIRVTADNGRILDSFYVWRTTSALTYRRAQEEQDLLKLFLDSRAGSVAEGDRITAQDLYLESGFLRRRLPADPVGTRINDAGRRLSLVLLTSPSPPVYRSVAELIKKQWAALGVDVTIEVPETRTIFEDRLLSRQYDVLLFGQSLLDNLDSYPYWHSSNAQKITENRNDLKLDAYNLSQYSSFEADGLLETIRSTIQEEERTKALRSLREVLKRDVPAIFLYTPLYTYAHDEGILGIELGNLSLHSDRFLTLYRWYVKQEHAFKPGMSWWSFFGWIGGEVSNSEPESTGPSLYGPL